MNVFTGWTGWATFAVLILTGWLSLGAVLAAAYHLTKHAWQRRYRRLDQVIAAEETRVTRLVREHARMTWPDDLCAFPPCWPEDHYVCSWHAPRGQKLRYDPEPIVAGSITDLPDPSDPWWTQ